MHPYKVIDHLCECKATIWFSVPSYLIYAINVKAFDDFLSNHSLRCILFGGESFPKSFLKKLYDLLSNKVDFYNIYGPSECTCISSSYKIGIDDINSPESLVPLGNIARNFDYCLVDPTSREKLFDSSIGELCLMGPQLGLGYINDSDSDSFSTINLDYLHSRRCYFTGDIVSIDSLNRLNFISRIDRQIKHRGYRIELDEIENIILKNIPEIEVAVIYTCEHPNNKTENSEIICFYSPIKEIGEDHIREITLLCLPHYMRPARLIYIRNMPRSPNGKLSRKSLISV